MTEGPHAPLHLTAHEATALAQLVNACRQPHVNRVVSPQGVLDPTLATLTTALERSAPGTLQVDRGQPVHAAAATTDRASSPPAVCGPDARGPVTNDRTLVDCEPCLALIADAQQQPCPNRCNDGYVERAATPEEVDAGFELGVAFDPCPACNPERCCSASNPHLGAPPDSGLHWLRATTEAALGVAGSIAPDPLDGPAS